MDRAVAKAVISLAGSIKTALDTINDNLYVPHITTQPTDFVGATGTDATFTVVANNVKGYQWQFKETEAGTVWSNTGAAGNTTASMTIRITDARYDYRFRCKITGLDNSVIYTDVVKMVAPTT